jgi:hypothetical protein
VGHGYRSQTQNVSGIIGFFGIFQPLGQSPSKDGGQAFFNNGGAGFGVVVLNFAQGDLLTVGVVDDVGGIGATVAGFADGTRVDDALEGVRGWQSGGGWVGESMGARLGGEPL